MAGGLYLASASPRRADLLRQIGITARCLPADVDESLHTGESACDYVQRLALAKAETVAARLGHIREPIWVLAADTTVFAAGEILAKPESFTDAKRIWSHLQASDHCVLTGIALWHDGVVLQRVVSTSVDFAGIPEAEQRAYWESGEPQDKAGGYAIQGRAALYIRGIEGSYSNVVGLPLAETAALLRQANYPLWL